MGPFIHAASNRHCDTPRGKAGLSEAGVTYLPERVGAPGKLKQGHRLKLNCDVPRIAPVTRLGSNKNDERPPPREQLRGHVKRMRGEKGSTRFLLWARHSSLVRCRKGPMP